MSATDAHSQVSDGDVIRTFLLSPTERPAFDTFFHLCYRRTLGYIRCLKARGFQLPIDDRTDRDPLSDLVYDILGSLLRSDAERPFVEVLDYFRRHEIDPAAASNEELEHHISVLLHGFTRKEISRLKKVVDPQIDNLKRRFKDILQSPDYDCTRVASDSAEYVYLRSHPYDPDDRRPRIPYARLEIVVEEAYLSSRSRAEWCRQVFELVAAEREFANPVRKHELLTAAVTVNLRHCDLEGSWTVRLPSGSDSLLLRTFEEARSETLDWLQRTVLADILAKGRLASSESDSFVAAIEAHLAVMAHIGQTERVGHLPLRD